MSAVEALKAPRGRWYRHLSGLRSAAMMVVSLHLATPGRFSGVRDRSSTGASQGLRFNRVGSMKQSWANSECGTSVPGQS